MFLVLFGVALVMVWMGVTVVRWQRYNTMVGVVAALGDPRRSAGELGRQVGDTERFAGRAMARYVPVPLEHLPEDYCLAAVKADEWGSRLLEVIRSADAVAPYAPRVNLLITCPLHVAFRVGAQLGTAGRRVVVYAELTEEGAGNYFPAVSLRQAGRPSRRPVVVGEVEQLEGNSADCVALAVDLGGKGKHFFGPVRAACGEQRVGSLLRVWNPDRRLSEDEETFTAVVDTVADAWAKSMSVGLSRRLVFVNGPPSIVVGLGAVLSKLGRWTPMAYETGPGRYVPFEPAGSVGGKRGGTA